MSRFRMEKRLPKNTTHPVILEALETRRLLSVNVLTWHNDNTRQGLNNNEISLTPGNVNASTFGKLFSYPVAAQVYAQPLYISNLTIPGKGIHNVVVVATMSNDVYAFDANTNSGVGAGVLWHVNLGLAATVPNPFFGNRYGPDHDTTPLVGITSTPVIDLVGNTIYIDAFTNDIPGQNAFSHHIHALNLLTGQDKLSPMLVTAAVKGNGVGGNGTTVTFDAEHQLQRPALTLFNGTLYIAYGAFADTDPYHGWVLGFNPATLQIISVLNTTPNADTDANAGEGGLWQAGSGLSSDGTRLYIETGNGDFNAALGDFSDSFIAITPDNSTPASPNLTGYGTKVSDYFTPYNEQQLADADADLGSSGSLVLPDQPGVHPHELIGSGKQGTIYLIDRDNMGQHTTTVDNVVQKVNLGHGVWGSPAYFNNSIYYHAVGDVLKRFALTNGRLSLAPAAQSTVPYFNQGGTPSISANGTANGIAWDVQWDASHEVLHAYNASTLTELYNSNQNTVRDQLGAGVKFITPTIADGKVFLGTSTSLSIYGLLVPVTTVPVAPSLLTATAPTPSAVNLTWIDNSDNENGFKIERSTDNINFTEIATTSTSTTSYIDLAVSPVSLYYYRIRATNIIGDSPYTSPSTSITTPAATGASNIYHFDAGTGTIAIDSAGNNSGTLVGGTHPQWITPGQIGASALSFNGDGIFNQSTPESSISVANDLSPILGGTSTLDVWIKTTQVGANLHWQAPAITGAEVGGANDINWGTLDSTGRIGVNVGDGGGVYSTNPVNDGKWHNIALTRDATSGQIQIYVDAVLSGAGFSDIGNKTSQFSLIGALSVLAPDGVTRTGANYFNGQLDELRIYNQILGASEISGLAQIPAVPVLLNATVFPGPVIHLVFAEPSTFVQSLAVYRKAGINGSYSLLATFAPTVNTYDDTGIVAGTAYYYVIKAIDLAGISPASNELGVTPPAPSIIGNHIFYNRSSFDGQNGSSNLTDRNAIAADKQALLPGNTASFQNYTSYSKGINGIIIDVANLVNLPRLDDFNFFVGNDNNPANWTTAPTPTYINAYPGRGPGGSTQITVIWDDNVIENEWLKVTMLALPHLNLTADDVFYFGNAIGETGDSISDASVTSADATLAGNNITGAAPVTNPYDINRDGLVDTADVSLITSHITTPANELTLISLPGSVPTISIAATATPNSVAVTSTQLSVLGADTLGDAGLIYTWSIVGSSPGIVTLSANGTNDSKNTTASFMNAGTYNFLVTVTNAALFSVNSSVSVQVIQSPGGISITPQSASIPANGTTQLTATALDQFGNPMLSQPPFSWAMSIGSGTVSSFGLYSASRTIGTGTVAATAAGYTAGSTTITAFNEVVAWHQADTASGFTLLDSSVNHQNATLTAPVGYVSGVSGNALNLTGGYASLPVGIVSSLNDFTISTWVKISSLQNWARIFDFGSGPNVNMYLTDDAGGTNALRFAITTGGAGAEQQLNGPALALNTWTHVAVTLLGNTATLYINGLAYDVNAGTTLHPTNLGTTTQNYIGKSQYADPALLGAVDDFRIYARALSAQQVLQLAVPTFVNPAQALPVTIINGGTKATLTALGADVTAGEFALTYTWTTLGSPPAPVTFSRNGTNAAKNSIVTFTKPGTYLFRVRIVNPIAGLSATSDMTLVVPAVTVINRAIFYNNSSYDNNDPTANILDDAAIATDKQALLPGQTATFANYTSYDKGINGLIVDLAGNTPLGTIDATDFTFQVSTDGVIYTAAPAVSSISSRPTPGNASSQRIEILFPDGSITNKWLRVTVLAGGHTGLAAPDVFYFGNLVGGTGQHNGVAIVNTTDIAIAKLAVNTAATITSIADFNRSGQITVTDISIAKLNNQHSIPLFTAPLPPPPVSAAAPAVARASAKTAAILPRVRSVTPFATTAVIPLTSSPSALSDILTGTKKKSGKTFFGN